MKRLPLLLTLLALAMFMCAGNAFSYTINDSTLVQSYYGSNPYKWQGEYWHEVIGSFVDFNIHGIDVTYSGGNITFDMYTNFNDDGTYDDGNLFVYLADLALDIDRNGSYEYGIVLLDHDKWGNSKPSNPNQGSAPTLTDLDVGLYSVSSWDTSSRFIGSVPGYIYGGKWDQGAPKTPNVAIAGTPTLAGNANVVFTNLGGSGEVGDPKHKWSVTIDAGDIGFSGGEMGMNLFWGGATCSNDAIGGMLSIQGDYPNPIPEPATLFLTGFGLIGLVVIGRSRGRKSRRRKL